MHLELLLLAWHNHRFDCSGEAAARWVAWVAARFCGAGVALCAWSCFGSRFSAHATQLTQSRNSTYATQLTHLALCNLHPSTYLIQFKQLNLHQASKATQVTHQQLTPLNLHNLTYTSHFTQLNSHNVTQTYTTLLTQLNWRNLTHTQLNSHK